MRVDTELSALLIWLKKMENKRILKYEKGGGSRELLPPHKSDDQISESTSTDLHYEHLPVSYTKTDGTLSTELIFVISGGTTRERAFLNEMEKKHTFKKVEVVFVSSDKKEGGLTPNEMQNKYIEIQRQGFFQMGIRKVIFQADDAVYMFTDVDHYMSQLKKIVADKDYNLNLQWIISNPDFEIWLYYCFRNKPYSELKEVIDARPSQRSSLLKTVNGRFNNGGGLDPRKAFENMETGIKNSKANYAENKGIPTLLSSQMHQFASDVLLKLGDEYKQWKAGQAKRRIRNQEIKKHGI